MLWRNVTYDFNFSNYLFIYLIITVFPLLRHFKFDSLLFLNEPVKKKKKKIEAMILIW